MEQVPMNVGDVYICDVPFSNNAKHKPRPVVIIGNPNSKGDILVIAGSSKKESWAEKFVVEVIHDDLETGVLTDTMVFPVPPGSIMPAGYLMTRK